MTNQNLNPDCRPHKTHSRGLTLTSTSLARLPLGCAVRRSLLLALGRHLYKLSAVVGLLLAAAYARRQLQLRRAATARVPALVSTTLDRLATQAALFSQGQAGESWISIGQLRDDVLRDEFSAVRREGIWKRVREIVEMNANVRASLREGRSGDVGRVWEWIGPTGFVEDGGSADRRKSGRYSLEAPGSRTHTPERDQVDGRGKEMMQSRKWDEGRPVY